MSLRMPTALFAALLACAPAAADESLVEPGAKVQKLASGMKFTEGPVWIPAKKIVVFSDIPNSKLMQWSEKDGLSEFRASEQANGNILDLEGRLLSCQHAGRNLVRAEADGKLTVLADKFEGQRFNSPNDLAVRSDGTIWFTDPPWGLTGKHEIQGHWVFKLDPATGKVEPVVKDLAMPNGIVFSPDESRLYIADTGGHTRHPNADFHKLPAGVHCYEVAKDGRLGKKLFQINAGSDGMKVDAAGRLFTTHGNKVQIYDPDGKPLEAIDTRRAGQCLLWRRGPADSVHHRPHLVVQHPTQEPWREAARSQVVIAMTHLARILWAALPAVWALCLASAAAGAEGPADFDAGLRPFFQTYCLRCHDAGKQEG